jgi:hypothetical protein
VNVFIDKRYKLFARDLFLCLLISIIIHIPALDFTAFSDDFSLLVASRKAHFHNWFSTRYLGGLSLFFEYQLFGDFLFYHHLFSLIYHGITGLFCLYVSRIVFLEFFGIQGSVASKSAWCVAILFLIYPFHLEAVFWISGRQIILAGMFGLIATYCFLRSRSFYTGYGLLAGLFYILALLSY